TPSRPDHTVLCHPGANREGGPMTTAPDHPAELGRARQLVAMLSAEKLRRGLGRLLTGDGPAEDPSVRGPLSRLDWLGEDGAADGAAVGRVAVWLALRPAHGAIHDVPRVGGLRVEAEESRRVRGRSARTAFERVGPE